MSKTLVAQLHKSAMMLLPWMGHGLDWVKNARLCTCSPAACKTPPIHCMLQREEWTASRASEGHDTSARNTVIEPWDFPNESVSKHWIARAVRPNTIICLAEESLSIFATIIPRPEVPPAYHSIVCWKDTRRHRHFHHIKIMSVSLCKYWHSLNARKWLGPRMLTRYNIRCSLMSRRCHVFLYRKAQI